MTALSDLLPLGPRALHQQMAKGYAIDPSRLDDTEYHGVALGMPRFVERLTWKTFKKVFRRDPVTGKLRGWNVAVEQRGVDGPFVDKTRKGQRLVYGPYEVHDAKDYVVPGPYGFGLVIDYGAAATGIDVQRLIRDPLVSLHEGRVDLLLGYSYLEMGVGRLRTPTYFALLRGHALDYDAYPAREAA